MTAATTDRASKPQDGKVYQVGLDGGATYNVFGGTALVYDTDGMVRPGANTAGFRFAGVATEGMRQTATATDGTNKVLVRRDGIHSFIIASAANSNVGQPVWLSDDQTVSLTQTSVGPIGKIVERVSSTEVLVDVGRAGHGGGQFLSWALGTDAMASASQTKEVSVGLLTAVSGVVCTQSVSTPAKVFGTDLTVTTGAITVARESSGTAEMNFNYMFAGY